MKAKILHNYRSVKKNAFTHQRESLKCYRMSFDGFTIILGEPNFSSVRLEVDSMASYEKLELGSCLKTGLVVPLVLTERSTLAEIRLRAPD